MNGYVACVQGLYFLMTGLWPLVNMDTFQRVTGPKVDLWLVKTVGVLVAVTGNRYARMFDGGWLHDHVELDLRDDIRIDQLAE